MNLLSQIITFAMLMLFLIYYNKIYISEPFLDTKSHYNDIFQTIFNQYNPYLQLYKFPIDLLKRKCYYTDITNNDIASFILSNLIDKKNIGNQILNTNIFTIQKNYLTGFLNEIFKMTRKTNILYHYYNKIININMFFSLLTNYIISYNYDQYNWIIMCYKIIIDNNLLIIGDNFNYSEIVIYCTYILNELKKYSYNLFKQNNNNLNIDTTLYVIKNIIFYGDDGKYFVNNNIFDCKKYIM